MMDNFERMRIEAELRKLAEMETRFVEVEGQITDVSNLLDDRERLRRAIAPILTDALRDAGADDPERVAETVAPYILETVRAEIMGTLSDEERLRDAVTPILPAVLREAGAGRHEAIANAMAPYVIDTVKLEIGNVQDELVEVIQPKLGVMVRSVVSDAIAELNRKVDEALPIDRWIAAIKGRLTGAPSAGFVIGEAQGFQVKEALLIERRSGELLARQTLAENTDETVQLDEDLLAGMIAALQGFAEDAYGPSGAGDLRRFSFTEDTVYLRASPTKILAVRCAGLAPPDIETRIDMLLEGALEQSRRGGEDPVLRLEDVQPFDEPESGVSASKLVGGGFGAAAAVVALIWGHGAVIDSHRDRWVAAVDDAVRMEDGLGPYPLQVSLSEDGHRVLVSGLVADDAALDRLEQRVEWAASPLTPEIDVAVIAAGDR